MPWTTAASFSLFLGTNTDWKPSFFASIAMGKAPLID